LEEEGRESTCKGGRKKGPQPWGWLPVGEEGGGKDGGEEGGKGTFID
jgi:hypothetical protein